jgi:hypothetical protein
MREAETGNGELASAPRWSIGTVTLSGLTIDSEDGLSTVVVF